MSESSFVRTLVVHRLEDYPDARVPLLALYVAMTVANITWLRSHMRAPALYASGVVYARESALDGPAEVLRDIPSVLRDGWGDCDDLACWRAAELVVRHGRKATPWLVPGGRAARYHVVVRDSATGRLHDPSAVLGMHADRTDPKHAHRRTQHGATF